MISEAEPLALAGVVITEVLQGLRRNVGEIERYLAMWEILEPAGYSTYREAADVFRRARAKGMSLSTIDALIVALALEHRARLFTLDKNFSRFAQLVNLPLHQAR